MIGLGIRVVIGLAAAGIAWTLIEVMDAQSQAQVKCVMPDDQERIRKLALDAYDVAFHKQVERLFEIWVTDYSPEPKRAAVGMQNAISALIRARADAMKWNPPPC